MKIKTTTLCFDQTRRAKKACSHPITQFKGFSWKDMKKKCTHFRPSTGDKGWIPIKDLQNLETMNGVALMEVHGMFEHAPAYTDCIEGI